MARSLRINFPGAFHHITARANERKNILNKSCDKNLLLKYIKKYIHLFNATLYAFIILDNHFHLLLQTGTVSISRIMQNLIGNFTMHYNKKYNRNGHLFQGRFKSCIVDDDNYLLACARYIHNNCIKAKICNKLEDYKWSSYNYYLKNTKSSFIETNTLLQKFNYNINSFKLFMNNYSESTINDNIKRIRDLSILGSQAFIEKVLNKSNIKLRNPHRKNGQVQPDTILNLIIKKFNLNKDILTVKTRVKAVEEARKITIYLLRKYSHLTTKQIGEIINIKDNSVSYILNNFNNIYYNKANLIIKKYLATEY